jgi:hypothetical protein
MHVIFEKVCKLAALAAPFALSSCPAQTTHEQAAKAASPGPAQFCPRPVEDPHYPDPQAAFDAYCTALNGGDWCDVPAMFDRPSRAKLVAANFKALALLAGTDSPRRTSYRIHFDTFCAKYELDCSKQGWLEMLVLDLLSSKNADTQMAAIESAAVRDPQDLYAEIMTQLRSVDPQASVTLEPTLIDVHMESGAAFGTVKRSDGRSSKQAFIKAPNGWLLTL